MNYPAAEQRGIAKEKLIIYAAERRGINPVAIKIWKRMDLILRNNLELQTQKFYNKIWSDLTCIPSGSCE